MHVTRRNLAVAGVLALGASSLLHSATAVAESSDEAAINQAVDALRKALLEADKARLEQLTADQLSYGHSGGRVETKAQFINGVVDRKAIVKTLTFPELTVAVAGNAAIARHIYLSDSETDGKPTNTRIGALQVWQKQDGTWKLLARQGFKLA
jgi:ketosteroid isomerase-like protein